jgi:hypothetical protein
MLSLIKFSERSKNLAENTRADLHVEDQRGMLCSSSYEYVSTDRLILDLTHQGRFNKIRRHQQSFDVNGIFALE